MKFIKNNIVLVVLVFFANLYLQAMENIETSKIDKFFDVMNIGYCVKISNNKISNNIDSVNNFINIFDSLLFSLFKSDKIGKKAFDNFLLWTLNCKSKSALLVSIIEKVKQTDHISQETIQSMETDGILPSEDDLKIIELICSKDVQAACDMLIKTVDIPDNQK